MRRFFAIATFVTAIIAAAQAQESRKWTIYFGDNETALSSEARTVLGVAIEMAQGCEKASVSLVGYDDTTRPPQKAEEMSMARAETVRKSMIDAGGVNADFKVDTRGQRQLPVPTPDGVSERQNRRVDISIACR